MSSLQFLRNLIFERSTAAAAEEIFRHVERIVVEYEEELDRQRRLLDIVCKPRLKLYRIDLPQKGVLKEEQEEEQQLCNQERYSSLDQDKPESLQIKEEEEEICTSQEQEQLELKQEADNFMLSPDNEESDHIKPEREKHVCNICKKCFRQKHSFMEHMRIHADERPFSCKTCGQCFRHSSELTSHKRIHTGEKPFSCEICGKCFRYNGHLKKHKRSHIDEKRENTTAAPVDVQASQPLCYIYHVKY
ncbi:zinc finger protein 41 homolog [Solea solea]|uniref:zinc finger protein 41 homolog n=1 Tax=Solea solea TaxID=90069 RepID=UPI00272C6DCB|nr:zinc finger protein 41 homolog [Solea solea]